MPEYYFSVSLDGDRTLHVAPLTDRRIAMSGQEINDASGYFLFESYGSGDNAEIEILAQAVSEEAALKLRDIMQNLETSDAAPITIAQYRRLMDRADEMAGKLERMRQLFDKLSDALGLERCRVQ